MDTVAIFNEGDVYRSIAGCFVVTALDSLLPGPDGTLRRNESLALDTVCVDNCPYYALPNVFSPNDDFVNDAFTAFPWKFVDSVDVRIYNRWGDLLFSSNDFGATAGWDPGAEEATEGTYYYELSIRRGQDELSVITFEGETLYPPNGDPVLTLTGSFSLLR